MGYMSKSLKSSIAVYMFVLHDKNSCGDPEGEVGPGIPPLENHKAKWFFQKEYWSFPKGKSQSYPASIQY